MAALASMAADIPNVDIFYVQAHGGGTHSLKNVMTTYNNYISNIFLSNNDIEKSGEGFNNKNYVFPMIGRLVSPGKSANSDFDSDKQTVNYIRNILSNNDFRKAEKKRLGNVSANTRNKSGAYTKSEGYRRFGELINNISLYSADEPIFNETVEVELISGRIFAGEEDAKENPGGFGIWKCGGDIQGWEYLSALSQNILLENTTGSSKDIQILEIVKNITEAFNNKNIIVIFPNCSPFGVESWTDSQRREVRNPIRIFSSVGESKTSTVNAINAVNLDKVFLKFQWTEVQQFQQMLLMLSRIQNFYQGNRNFRTLLETDETNFNTSCEKYEKDPKTDKEKVEKWIEGPIGVMDKDDSKFLYSVITYFISKYPLTNNFLKDTYFTEENNEFLYASNRLGYVTEEEGIDFIMYVYLTLFLAFTVNESNGGIFRDTKERKTLSNLKKEINKKFITFLKTDSDKKTKIKKLSKKLSEFRKVINGLEPVGRVEAWGRLMSQARTGAFTVINREEDPLNTPIVIRDLEKEFLELMKRLGSPQEKKGGSKKRKKRTRKKIKKKGKKKKTRKKRKSKRKR